ncbi:rRNA maturation RNase YbeY [Patescibacteria group bacterium]|nr:rRNA maturation RNase YbeY [Patescibacteria group bacterium]
MIKVEINYQVKVPLKLETLFNKVAVSISRKLKIKKLLPVSVALVSQQVIKRLNQRYRGQNKVTDVLSFPELNEILICYQRAVFQAKERKQSQQEQLAWLFCHGLLHLLGYHHRTKSREKIIRKLEAGALEEI